MAVFTYPLSLADFWLTLKIGSCDIRPGGGAQQQATGGGEVITSKVGVRLWEGEATVVASDDPGRTEAILNALQEPGRSFMVVAHKRPYPLMDPEAALLGGASPIIASLPAGGRTLTISGLPAGYVLSEGDFLSFTRGSPVRHELVQIVTGAVASVGGVTPEFEVTPGLRPGVTVSTPVVLVRPFFRAVILPGSVKFAPLTRGPRPGPTFGFRQTLAQASP